MRTKSRERTWLLWASVQVLETVIKLNFVQETCHRFVYLFSKGGGLRFAHLEMKLLLTKILSKYKFERCDKTVKKIEIDKAGTRTQTKGPIIVKLSER